MSRRHRLASLCLTVTALAAVAGCGSEDSADGTTSTAAVATDGQVAVELTEYRIAATPAVAAAGPVTFTVANDGAIPHELLVLRTARKAADLLLTGTRADTSGTRGELDDRALAVGTKKDLTLALGPGHYALICNLPGHYQGGMHLDFTVK